MLSGAIQLTDIIRLSAADAMLIVDIALIKFVGVLWHSSGSMAGHHRFSRAKGGRLLFMHRPCWLVLGK